MSVYYVTKALLRNGWVIDKQEDKNGLTIIEAYFDKKSEGKSHCRPRFKWTSSDIFADLTVDSVFDPRVKHHFREVIYGENFFAELNKIATAMWQFSQLTLKESYESAVAAKTGLQKNKRSNANRKVRKVKKPKN